MNIWFRARKVTGTFEKRGPAPNLLASLIVKAPHVSQGFEYRTPAWILSGFLFSTAKIPSEVYNCDDLL